MPLKEWSTALLLAALVALTGCSRTPSDPDAPTSPASAAGAAPVSEARLMEATWQGVLPCTDCDGIQTRLRLVADGQGRRYELQEAYLSGDGGAQFESQGEWSEETAVIDGAQTVVYRLDIQGASRWFSLEPDGALELLETRGRASVDGLAHRLQRM